MNPISIFIPESQSSFKLDSSEEDRPISAPSNSSSQTRKENIFILASRCNIVVSLSGFFFFSLSLPLSASIISLATCYSWLWVSKKPVLALFQKLVRQRRINLPDDLNLNFRVNFCWSMFVINTTRGSLRHNIYMYPSWKTSAAPRDSAWSYFLWPKK